MFVRATIYKEEQVLFEWNIYILSKDIDRDDEDYVKKKVYKKQNKKKDDLHSSQLIGLNASYRRFFNTEIKIKILIYLFYNQ